MDELGCEEPCFMDEPGREEPCKLEKQSCEELRHMDELGCEDEFVYEETYYSRWMSLVVWRPTR
jgi:hypothetical protein